jgi:tetratricopeptide (TPR) repeat protein
MIGSTRRAFTIVVGMLAIALAFALAACSSGPEEVAEAASPKSSEAAAQPHATAPVKEVPITTTSEEARSLYLQGRDLVEKIRFTDGNKYFHQAVDKDPDFALAWLAAANSSATAQEFFDEMKRAVAGASRVSEGEQHMIRGADAGARSDPAAQLDHYTKLAEMFPDDARALNLLAGYHFGTQDYAKAAEIYNRAIVADPKLSTSYNQLGYAQRFLMHYPESEQAFKTYIELIPDDPNPYDSYAELLMKMGRFDESIVQYQKALSIDPNFVPSYIGIANDNMFMGRPGEARESLARLQGVARNDGERRQALTWMAASYLFEGRTKEAMKKVRELRDVAEKGADMASVSGDYQLAGDVLLNTGSPDEALGSYRKAVETIVSANVPEEVKAAVKRNHLYNEARVALAKKDVATAKARTEAYRREVDAKKVPFELRQAHELSGRIATAEGDYPRAIEELGAANQQNPMVVYLSAVAYKKSGDAAKAKEMADKAANFNGLNLNYAYVRGKAKQMLQSL